MALDNPTLCLLELRLAQLTSFYPKPRHETSIQRDVVCEGIVILGFVLNSKRAPRTNLETLSTSPVLEPLHAVEN